MLYDSFVGMTLGENWRAVLLIGAKSMLYSSLGE